ncbi:MAG TPA: hypothetical protein VNZ86_01710 [Bacteroidia bacterium]|jgi:hypothetical protein|nr:hypothetical protein [Bacteroidia bacterium]
MALIRQILLFLFLASSASLPGQSVYFGNTFGGPSQDIGRSAIQTADGQYVATGPTSSYGAGSSDVWLVKTDLNGVPRWTHTYGGTGVDWANFVRETKSDSGLVICGYTDSYGNGGYDVYLIKTDSAGTMLWSKTYGGSNWDLGYMVQPTADGGFIIAGGTYSYGAGDEDVYLIKTDALGDTSWTRHYGGVKQDEGRSVKQTLDGGYIIAGFTRSYGDTAGDAFIIRTKPNGDTLWTRHVGGAFADDAHDIIQVSDSSFYFLGSTRSYGTGTDQDMFMGHFDTSGNLIWTIHTGGTAPDRGESLLEQDANTLALLGSTQSYGYSNGTWDIWMTLTDKYGNYIPGGNTYGDPHSASDEEGYSIFRTKDKGYLLCGYSTGFMTNGIPDFFLVHTDSLAHNVPLIAGIMPLSGPGNTPFVFFPNPVYDQATLQYTNPCLIPELRLFSPDGRDCTAHMKVEKGGPKELRLSFDRSALPSGIFFYELRMNEKRVMGKLILR